MWWEEGQGWYFAEEEKIKGNKQTNLSVIKNGRICGETGEKLGMKL